MKKSRKCLFLRLISYIHLLYVVFETENINTCVVQFDLKRYVSSRKNDKEFFFQINILLPHFFMILFVAGNKKKIEFRCFSCGKERKQKMVQNS